MTKIELIEKITEFHPAAFSSRAREWSWYVGGMADTGGWYYPKLLRASKKKLLKCLEELEEEFKPHPPPVYTEEEKKDMNTIVRNGNSWMTLFMVKQLQKIRDNFEMHLIWGKTTK